MAVKASYIYQTTPTISRLWETQEDLEAEHSGKEGMVSETLTFQKQVDSSLSKNQALIS